MVTVCDREVDIYEMFTLAQEKDVPLLVRKSGCKVEDCRLKTADRLQNYIALMAVVAWRLLWLTYINRAEPDLPCTAILTATEWESLYMRIHKTTPLPQSVPTVRQAVRYLWVIDRTKDN